MKKLGLIWMLLLFFIGGVRADIAPDPGFTKVALDLNIDAKEEFPEFRFFLDFPGIVTEVVIKKGSNSVRAMGGGARYSSGTLWAVPKTSVKTNDKSEISKALGENKLAGAIKLTQHQFSRIMRESESAKVPNPTYLLERDGDKGLKITKQTTQIEQVDDQNGEANFAGGGVAKSFVITGSIVAVGFASIAIVILGIWFFRRKARKLG